MRGRRLRARKAANLDNVGGVCVGEGLVTNRSLPTHVLLSVEEYRRLVGERRSLVDALKCAGLHVPDPRAERDALIAATALVHGMTVVTGNVSDFEATGVALVDPWGEP